MSFCPQLLCSMSRFSLHWTTLCRRIEQFKGPLVLHRSVSDEIESLKSMKSISKSSHPFVDKYSMEFGCPTPSMSFCPQLLCSVFSKTLHGRHEQTALIIWASMPSLVNSSLSRQFHIVGQRIVVCSITRACITCRRLTVRPHGPVATRENHSRHGVQKRWYWSCPPEIGPCV